MLRRAIILLSATLLVLVLLPAADGQSSIESELLGLINGGRGSRLTAHSGLRDMGRVHSQEMSHAGGLNHNGAAERNQQAPPDPTEPNGAPDDGFTGTWCENVAYVRGAPEHEIAQRMYDAWTRSAPHNRCMNDERMTVAGIGLHFEGNTYWATLESSVDQTLPGSAPPPTPPPTPSPTPTPEITPRMRTEPPERTEPPAPTDRPEPTPRPEQTEPPILQLSPSASPVPEEAIDRVLGASSDVRGRTGSATDRFIASPALPTGEQNTISWFGLLAALAVLALFAELLRRLSSRRDESEAT